MYLKNLIVYAPNNKYIHLSAVLCYGLLQAISIYTYT